MDIRIVRIPRVIFESFVREQINKKRQHFTSLICDFPINFIFLFASKVGDKSDLCFHHISLVLVHVPLFPHVYLSLLLYLHIVTVIHPYIGMFGLGEIERRAGDRVGESLLVFGYLPTNYSSIHLILLHTHISPNSLTPILLASM